MRCFCSNRINRQNDSRKKQTGRQEIFFKERLFTGLGFYHETMALFWRKNLNRLRDQKAVLYHARNSCFFTWAISSSSTAVCCWCIRASVGNSVVPVILWPLFLWGFVALLKLTIQHNLFDIILLLSWYNFLQGFYALLRWSSLKQKRSKVRVSSRHVKCDRCRGL